jgi:hypothetical protein
VDEFRDMLKFGVDNAAKPIFIFTVDGSWSRHIFYFNQWYFKLEL